MAKKFYAVKKGHKKGIFESWDECKKNINGYSGAIYKSFKTLNEANNFWIIMKKFLNQVI